MKRISLSLPDELIRDYDLIASALGYSRSAVIVSMMQMGREPLLQVANAMVKFNKSKNAQDAAVVRRARGESLEDLYELITTLTAELEADVQGGLFNDE